MNLSLSFHFKTNTSILIHLPYLQYPSKKMQGSQHIRLLILQILLYCFARKSTCVRHMERCVLSPLAHVKMMAFNIQISVSLKALLSVSSYFTNCFVNRIFFEFTFTLKLIGCNLSRMPVLSEHFCHNLSKIVVTDSRTFLKLS